MHDLAIIQINAKFKFIFDYHITRDIKGISNISQNDGK